MANFFIKWIFGFVLCFLCLSEIFPQTHKPRYEQNGTTKKFYDLLVEIRDYSRDIQLARLEEFVEKNNGFTRGAKWLFNEYVIAAKLQRAEVFFTSLPDSGESFLTKNWMLGKLHAHKGQTNQALQAFTVALRTVSPPPELMLDFAIFDTKSLRKFEDPKYRSELCLGTENLKVMTAFWFYVICEWQKALTNYGALSPKTQNNLTVMYTWGYCFWRSDQKMLAQEKWLEGLKLSRAQLDREFESKFLQHLGLVVSTIDKTLTYYDSSYAIATNIGEFKRLEFLAGNLGILYGRQGRFALADSLFQEAILLAHRLQSPSRLSNWYRRYGTLLRHLDRFDEALDMYDKGADLAKKTGNIEGLVRCKIREGELYRILGQYELAHSTLSVAYEESKKRNWPILETLAHIELAQLNLEWGWTSRARAIYNKYLAVEPSIHHDLQDHTWWRIQVGRTYFSEKDIESARREFENAYSLAVSSKIDYYTSLSLLELTRVDLFENQFSQAHAHLDECLDMAENSEIKKVLPAIYSLRGDAFRQAGSLKEAVTQYKQAAHLIEGMRDSLNTEDTRLQFFGGKSDIYGKLVDCYKALYEARGDPTYRDSIYAYIELKRGRTLRELRTENEIAEEKADTDFKREKLQQAKSRLETQQRHLRIHGAQLSHDELDSALTQVQISRLSVVAQKLRLSHDVTLTSDTLLSELPSLQELRSTLSASRAAAIFYHFSELPFALTTTGDTTAVISLSSSASNTTDSIESLLKPFYSAGSSETIFKADLAYELYQTLVAPIESAIDLPENLLILPDEKIANLPFELLLTSQPERPSYPTTDTLTCADAFLVQRYAIGYVPNASFIKESGRRRHSPSTLVFADPYDEVPLVNGQMPSGYALVRTWAQIGIGPVPPLLNAMPEAENIQSIHTNTKIFSQENATRETFLKEAPSYDILHFATHAFFDAMYDVFSGLALSLSQDEEDDGFLMGYEIADLKLQADLVTLSACETGRGKVVSGEGVLGLPRLFLGAGANSVLMTHWRVDDKFASRLMVDFYEHYLNQGLSKVNALTEAKRIALKTNEPAGGVDYRHPFYWASFVMHGEPGFNKSAGNSNVIMIVALAGLLLSASIYLLYARRQRRRPLAAPSFN